MFREIFALGLAMGLPLSAGMLHAGDFPTPVDTQELTIPFVSAKDSLAKMALPKGFKATVFAAEPDVNNPIACCWDEKGRLWVVENFTYGDNSERYNLNLRDRILIFEDTDNDGVFDSRKVFTDQLQMVTSIERGLGGVWVVAPPSLLFIPDGNGDDIPDGPPQVKLDGFSTQAASRHTFANGLKWGPDGWLYGRCGITSTSYIGVPGAKDDEKVATAGGLWRYHPVKNVVDIVCAGTTNPWGHDWNEHGELFFINTVIGHLWHGIHGAHMKRMHGQDLNPRVYLQMDQIADHYHWDTGGSWTDSREGAKGFATADALGGGHAHVGMMIYQGINWPESYRGKLFTLNLHGRRLNVERLERRGSSYVGKHEPDMLKTEDPWFRGIDLTYGPDGGVYLLDWSDIGECHENDGVHRNSGRIYKITYGDVVKPVETELGKLDLAKLAELTVNSDNGWLVRMARMELRERKHRGEDLEVALQKIKEMGFGKDRDSVTVIRAWSALALIGSLDEQELLEAMRGGDEYVQGFALKLLFDVWQSQQQQGARIAPLVEVTGEKLGLLKGLAAGSKSSSVRLELASSLQKLKDEPRVELAAVLFQHEEDEKDPYLPLMYWYGIMDLPPAKMVKLYADCRIGLVRKFITRRCAEDLESAPQPLNLLLATGKHAHDVLDGMAEALEGWAKAKKPDAWDGFVANFGKDAALVDKAQNLGVLFGDGRAIDDIKKIALDENADFAKRNNALQSLIAAKADGLKEICLRLMKTRGLNITAMRGLALFDDDEIGKQMALSFHNFYPNEQSMLIDTLASRKSFAKALLQQVKQNRVPKNLISVIHARQIRSFKDGELDTMLSDVWGEIRESSADKQKLIADLKAKLTPEVLAQGDPRSGRVIYQQLCATCHKLYGEGHDIGPDLTGSGRKDINYLIENIVDPNALLPTDYRMTVVKMKDGRVLSGTVAAKTERTTTLKMVGVVQVVENEQIESMQQLPVSLMPEGLLMSLNETQIRDLMNYLMTDAQVELTPSS